jgi:HNH endonuclease
VNCLYCPRALNGSDEHVILSAIGGRKSSTRILCSECNNRFGSTIDAELLKTVRYFTLIIDPPSRRRDNAQKLRVTDDRGDIYEMRAGGRLKIPMKQVEPNRWMADASDAAYLQHHTKRAAEALGQRTGETAEVISITREQKPRPLMLPGKIDNFIATRAMLKWVLNLLGMHVLTTGALRELHILKLERSFVSDGKTPPLAGYVERSLMPQLYDGLLHYALAMQTPNRSVYWEAAAYGGIVAIAGRTAPIPTRFSPILYFVDPVTGKDSMANVTGNGHLSNDECKWTPQPAPVVQERIARAGVRLMQLMNRRIGIDRLIDECTKEHLPTGVPITQEHVNAVSRCMADRYIELIRQVDKLGNTI